MFSISKKIFVVLCLFIFTIAITACGPEPVLEQNDVMPGSVVNGSGNIAMDETENKSGASLGESEDQISDGSASGDRDKETNVIGEMISNLIESNAPDLVVAIEDLLPEDLPIATSFVDGLYENDVVIVSPDLGLALRAGAVISTGEDEKSRIDITVSSCVDTDNIIAGSSGSTQSGVEECHEVEASTRIVHTSPETEWKIDDSEKLGAVLLELVEGEITVIDDGEGYFPMQINTPIGSVRLLGTWVVVSQSGDWLTVKCFRGPCQYLTEGFQRVLLDEESLTTDGTEVSDTQDMTEDDVAHFMNLPEVQARVIHPDERREAISYRNFVNEMAIMANVFSPDPNDWQPAYHQIARARVGWVTEFLEQPTVISSQLQFELPSIGDVATPSFGEIWIVADYNSPRLTFNDEELRLNEEELGALLDRCSNMDSDTSVSMLYRTFDNLHHQLGRFEYQDYNCIRSQIPDGLIYYTVPATQLALLDGDRLQVSYGYWDWERDGSDRYTPPQRVELLPERDYSRDWYRDYEFMEAIRDIVATMRTIPATVVAQQSMDGGVAVYDYDFNRDWADTFASGDAGAHSVAQGMLEWNRGARDQILVSVGPPRVAVTIDGDIMQPEMGSVEMVEECQWHRWDYYPDHYCESENELGPVLGQAVPIVPRSDGVFAFMSMSKWIPLNLTVTLTLKGTDGTTLQEMTEVKYADLFRFNDDGSPKIEINYETPPERVDITLGSPASGGIVDTFQPTLDWSASGPVDHYSVYVSHASGQLEKVTDLTQTSHTVTTKELIPGEEYVWMVRAFTANNVEIGMSEASQFTVGFVDIRNPLSTSLTDTLSSLGDNLRQVLYQERATREWFVYDADNSFSLDVLSQASPGTTPDSVGAISSIDNGQAVYINVANDAVFMGQNLYAGLNLVVWNP